MTVERAWLALVDDYPSDATASAPVEGAATGWLAMWLQKHKPVRHALRADPAAFASDGPPAAASFVVIKPPREVLFDDLAVQRARQLVLAGGPWTAVTTLVSDSSHFRGSLVAAPASGDFDDPFALIAMPLTLSVGPGLLSAGPLRLPSPVVERYAGQPWPQSGFPS